MADDNDDDVCDSWEDMLDSDVLEEKLKKITPHTLSEEENIALTCVPGGYLGPMILHEDTVRTPYTPPEPQVKILKRPSNSTTTSTSSTSSSYHESNTTTTNLNTNATMSINPFMNGGVNKQPVKTLQQREAEYAEARLRILGSAKSEEEMAEERLARVSGQHPCEIAVRGLHLQDSLNKVIRQPRGPDGSSGFSLKR